MVAVVVQARFDSSRLPGKALLPLADRPILIRVLEALSHIPCDRYILACPEDCVTMFEPLAQETAFDLSPGSKEDVLNRYCDAIRRFKIDRVIRATADNPFVFADAAQEINQEATAVSADYAGYQRLPYGAGVESVAAEALLKAEREALHAAEREHVCPYLYNHPELFSLHRPLAPHVWQEPEFRLTIDTPEDYERAQKLYTFLPSNSFRYNGSTINAAYRRLFV